MLSIKQGPLRETNLTEDDPQLQLQIHHPSLNTKHSQTCCMSLTSQRNTKYIVQNRSIWGRKVTQSRSLQPLTSCYDACINCPICKELRSLASTVPLFSFISNFRGFRNFPPHIFCNSRFAWSKQRPLPSTFLFIVHNNRILWLDDV
jgi:hypothetical protein